MKPADRARFTRRLQALRSQILEAGPAKIEPNRKDSSATGVPDEDLQDDLVILAKYIALLSR